MKPSSICHSLAAAAAIAATFACTTGAPYSEVAGTPPPLGQGRILFYMTAAEGTWWPDIGVDAAPLGKLRPGTFFYVDRAAGQHQLGVLPDPHLAGFGNQGATPPVTVLVESGQVAYVQVTVVATVGMITAVLEPEPAADAQRDLAHLDFVPPANP